jgi:Putative lumazine-binding
LEFFAMDNPHHQSQDDETKIRAAALDYIGAVLEADPARMERCLHPELVKRAYLPGVDGRPQLSHMSALNLILDAKTFRANPDRKAEVVILDRYEGAASVRTTFDRWIDYMHIVNVGNEWKIINVLWELTPEVWASRSDKPRSSEPSWPRGH